jgi:hypothetical protein
MKWILAILIASVITTFSLYRNKPPASKKELSHPISKSFALLELFTSEGCSSCPSADRLLPELVKSDSNIIALSFHVDYWDNLGWKDAFSNPSFTERQRQYGEQFHLESIYTPQLVINGEYELVGSNRQKAENLIEKAENESSATKIIINNVKENNQSVEISCTLSGDITNTELVAAIVQKHAERKINGGENKGATLTHTNIVRSLTKNDAKAEMKFNVKLPPELKKADWQLIFYTQRKTDLKITSATSYL